MKTPWRSWAVRGGWLLRRPIVGPGESAHPYIVGMRTNYAIFIGISAIEIPVLHFLIPWQTVRHILVVLSVWGLLWCLGLLAQSTRHPRLVTPGAVRLRYGATVDVRIDWERIESLTIQRGFSSEG